MPQNIKIKICGITNIEDALLAVELGADALGFIFSESKRKITLPEAEKIISCLPPFITCVGVFVNEFPEKVVEIFLNCKINTFQLCGDESPLYCQNFPNTTVIKSFRIKDEKSLEKIVDYETVDAILLDTFTEDGFGGSGKTFDWNLAVVAKKFQKPIILSGGLTPENVGEAISKVKPYAVDVCSGVESYPGKKDEKKMRQFIEEVKKFLLLSCMPLLLLL